jgi:hypothetical protein
MKANLVQTIAGAVIVMLLGVSAAPAQVPPLPPPNQATLQFTPPQLDQMLAPIALYPDPLLAQVLMAATYPLEVVQADRWLQTPGNAALTGAQLAAALEPLAWDPSVKSLVPFPQILHMMNRNLDWTERLGDAFLADQAAVMDAVQRLRQRAEAAGKLGSTPQQVVTTQGPLIMIEPVSPGIVYIPVYNPMLVYGVWPYPELPPYYFPDFFPGVVIGGFGFGWFGVSIVAPLWGWDHWDWGRHRIDIDRNWFASFNRQRPPVGGGTWEHDPLHRHGVPYRDSATRARFPGAAVSPDALRSFRGYPTGPAVQSRPAPGGALPQVIRPQAAPPTAVRPQAAPPVFQSYGRGAEIRSQAERGQSSRMSMPASPSRGAAPRSAPSSGTKGRL